MFAGCSDDDKGEIVLPESNLTVDPETEIVFRQTEESAALSINTNRNWVIAKGEENWYRIEGEVNGEPGEHSVNVVVSENGGVEKRESKISIQAGREVKELSVVQFGSEPDMALPEKEITVDYQTGIREFVVNSNTTVEVTTTDGWLQLLEKYSMDNKVSNVYRVAYGENTGAKRSGKLTVKAGTKEEQISFVQEAWKAEIFLDQDQLVVGGMKEYGEVLLVASGNWTIEYEGGQKPQWITDAPEGGSEKRVVLKFEFSRNQDSEQRSCKVIVRCGDLTKTLTIVQLPVLKRERDSLALQTIYRAALSHGDVTWDFAQPMSTWEGVKLTNGRVINLRCAQWEFDKIPTALGELDVLTMMTFAYCHFKDPMLPDEVANWSLLTEFACIGEQAVRFPKAVREWNSLNKLIMSGDFFNKMTLSGVVLDESLCEIPTLRSIYVQYSDIKEFPEKLASSNVEVLILDEGQLTEIPAFLGGMQKLTFLQIRNCPINGPVPAKLFDAPQLKSCVLSHNGLTGTIPEEAYRHPNLYEFNLGANNLEGDVSVALVSSKIQMFDVTMNRLGGSGKILDEDIKYDPRFGNAQAWNGIVQICKQQDGYGWSNCSN